ncbi:MAG: glutamine-hydrolyzing carbamoyl-phosphate synthase small subunit [Planctomycetes bacterium]|nr:glutamine-hydrolyzing carbamoyl-phosphate synthase small subunit [Planctomycetota bacterium]
MTHRTALLALEDGTVFAGRAFGAEAEAAGEIVFNTSMTGYQEVLTDPSYHGQIVAMTYPLIGNYGTNAEDVESHRPWVEGFVVREVSRRASNWRAGGGLDAYLREADIPGIEGLDTRALTRHIRTAGAMKAVLSTLDDDPKRVVEKARASPGLVGRDLVRDVTCAEPWEWEPASAPPDGPLVALLDYGVKTNILRCLREVGCRVLVMPASSTAEAIADRRPAGLMLSNGPGDPAAVPYAVEALRRLIHEPPGGRPVPIFGICMGHQMLGQALGGTTYKLKFGHHGANHPAKDLATGQVAITVQNHGFCVDIESLPPSEVEVTHLNLNDQTLEGLRHRRLPMFSVQFHPEASPGPHDAHYLFRRFRALVEQHARA